MKGGTLEVLLVNAQGIRHTNLIGRPKYYVVVECGAQEQSSKVSKGEHCHRAFWNEKIVFEFPLSRWRKLTHIKFRIMDKELFTEGGFVGETIIHLGGIVTEGSDRGCIELKPAPYNVVLDDDTFKGLIRIGFKFIADKKQPLKNMELAVKKYEPNVLPSMSFLNLWQLPWLKFLFYCFRKTSKCHLKEN